jgi:uncharacterized protein
MINPFRFGNPVEGEFYLDRPELQKTVLSFLNNGTNIVLVGPRRFGKTSFIINLLRHQETVVGRAGALVDVFNVTSHRDFLQQLVNALREKKPLLVKLRDWIEQLPSNLKPLLTLENEHIGKVSLRFSPQRASETDVKQLIIETLDSLGVIVPNLCIAFDEFQTIANLDDGGWLEATIRSKMQEHKSVSFLFSGSRRSIIHDMFNNNNRPFYRSCQLMEFPSLDADFTRWVVDRFAAVNIKCTLDMVEYLRGQVSDTPNYVQMLCFHVVAGGCRHVTKEIIDDAAQTIIKQNAYAYQTLLNSLTLVQQRVLRLAAFEKESVFAKENLEKYEIKTAAHVSQAINALKEKQILDESTQKGRVVFDDPLFALWLQYQFPDLANPQQPMLPLV